MQTGKSRLDRVILSVGTILLFLIVAVSQGLATPENEILPPGYRPIPPGTHALVGADVVVKPGEVISNATIIIRDGMIQEVGAKIAPPGDARVWDMKGLTIYAGFIDPYLTLAKKGPEKPEPSADEPELTGGGIKFFGLQPQQSESGPVTGPVYEVAAIKPERRVADSFQPDPKAMQEMREIGFTTGNIVPEQGVIRGTSAFAALGDSEPGQAIMKPDLFQNIGLGGMRNRRDGGYPESLMGKIAAVRQAFFDAQYYILDQEDYAKHSKHRTRPEYNLGLDALRPVVERKMRVVFDPQDALMVDRVARMAKELNFDFYVVSSGQEWRRPDLAKAAATAFIVPLKFPELPKMPRDDDWDQVSLDEFRAWDWAPENPALLRKQGLEVALTTHGLDSKKDFRKNLRLALARGLSTNDALAALTTIPARLCGMEKSLGTVEAGKIANLTVVDGKGYFDAEAKVNSVWIDGRYYRIPGEAPKDKEKSAKDKDKEATKEIAKSEDQDKDKEAKKDPEKEKKEKEDKEKKLARQKELEKRVAHSPLEGRGVLASPSEILITNATIWTCGPEGVLSNADLLIVDGKIKKAGRNLKHEVPSSGLAIDGTGLHVTPGIVDCHSHSMIVGDVNEGTLPSTAMCRIGDVVNSETDNIYLQLAGGVTVANLLHGSANPIGGQNQVIKLRDGDTPEELKLAAAPQGIKFALGENVKQSNWGERNVSRYPQTRMGVHTFYENRFTAARQYLQAMAEAKKSGSLPPRRDLELEALGEILEGTRLIHCHSYRQDEILMLMRTMESFGVRIGTFQHVLEGYKIADEIAKHGAGGSSFADWWAYKFEVYDAIPYNGSIMHDRGVVVSFNSDSPDLARRLYLEAAKAVKYGGTSEIEALKFVTLNPAIQLRIDKYIGSLEPGKDADFAIWSKAPLDSLTVCQQTWIDGKKYFDIKLAPGRTEALAKERADLLAKAKKMSKPPGPGGGEGEGKSDGSFFEKSLEHEYDGVIRHCLDDDDE